MLGFIVVLLTAGVGIGFALLIIGTLRQWQGGWRWALAIPVLVMMGVILNIVIVIWLDPTAHNLWPIELLAWFCLTSVSVGILYLLRWIIHRPVET